MLYIANMMYCSIILVITITTRGPMYPGQLVGPEPNAQTNCSYCNTKGNRGCASLPASLSCNKPN